MRACRNKLGVIKVLIKNMQETTQQNNRVGWRR